MPASVEWAGLEGMKNGVLLQAAEGGGYQVLLTADLAKPDQRPRARHLEDSHLC